MDLAVRRVAGAAICVAKELMDPFRPKSEATEADFIALIDWIDRNYEPSEQTVDLMRER
jgi:hypothetical protein